GGARVALLAPVVEDDDEVGLLAGGSHGGGGAGQVAGHRDARPVVEGGPGELQLVYLAEGEDRDLHALHGDVQRGEGLGGVVADPHVREVGPPYVVEGVGEPDLAVVQDVVVGHGDRVDAGVAYR